MIIYKIQNKINGKIYIGQTKFNLNQRISDHLRNKSLIGNALRKYGLQYFDIFVIDVASDHKILCDKEMEYINFYNCKSPNGYNLTDGGEGFVGHVWTEEEKKKLRKPHGPFSEESKQNMRKPHGPFSEETKKNMRKPHGPMSEGAKKNMKGSPGPRSEEAKKNMKGSPGPKSEEFKQNLRKPKSEEAKRNMSESHIGKPWSKSRREAQKRTKVG